MLDMGAIEEATAKLSQALTKAVQINSPQAVVLSAVVTRDGQAAFRLMQAIP